MIFLADKLRHFRESAGYSQKQIAGLLGCDRSTYTYYEIGRTRPDIIVLGKICKILGLKCEQLISECDEQMALCDNTPDNKNSNKCGEEFSKIYELSKKEKELVAYFRLMDNKNKESLLKKLDNKNKKDSPFSKT